MRNFAFHRWLPRVDSNHHLLIQSQASCRWTTRQQLEPGAHRRAFQDLGASAWSRHSLDSPAGLEPACSALEARRLYPFSHGEKLVGLTGFEPAASSVGDSRSSS